MLTTAGALSDNILRRAGLIAGDNSAGSHVGSGNPAAQLVALPVLPVVPENILGRSALGVDTGTGLQRFPAVAEQSPLGNLAQVAALERQGRLYVPTVTLTTPPCGSEPAHRPQLHTASAGLEDPLARITAAAVNENPLSIQRAATILTAAAAVAANQLQQQQQHQQHQQLRAQQQHVELGQQLAGRSGATSTPPQLAQPLSRLFPPTGDLLMSSGCAGGSSPGREHSSGLSTPVPHGHSPAATASQPMNTSVSPLQHLHTHTSVVSGSRHQRRQSGAPPPHKRPKSHAHSTVGAQTSVVTTTAVPTSWAATFGNDLSLSGFGDIGSPNLQDVLRFVDRQASTTEQKPDMPSGSGLGAADTDPTAGGRLSSTNLQYILMAETSAAVPVEQETLTYLNQGQSYEILCKAYSPTTPGSAPMTAVSSTSGAGLCASSDLPKLYKTIFALCFHDRRQKFEEGRLLNEWRRLHPDKNPIVADIPICVNCYNVVNGVNSVEVLWDPNKVNSASVYIKINCISTEFTAKKHGGEKGVPFRIVATTYAMSDQGLDPKKIHSAYAQIRVFKLKGADRKNRMDRERAEKYMSSGGKGGRVRDGSHESGSRFQTACEHTMFTETFPTDLSNYEETTSQYSDDQIRLVDSGDVKPFSIDSSSCGAVGDSTTTGSVPDRDRWSPRETEPPSPFRKFHPLHSDSSPDDVAEWLRAQRFESFSGTDLLRLSYDELMLIIKNESDAIRLHNALRARPVNSFKTLYIKPRGYDHAYSALYLSSASERELRSRLAAATGCQKDDDISEMLWFESNSGIWVNVTDEVISHMPNKAPLSYEFISTDPAPSTWKLLLRSDRTESSS